MVSWHTTTLPLFSLLILYVLLLGFFAPSLVHAQFDVASQFDATLVLDPKFPEPHEEVTISLDAYSLDTIGATISWFVNNIEVVSARDSRAITLTVGNVGSKDTVHAVVILSTGKAIRVVKEIIPSSLDIIIEADTYVPVFYEGRALPSRGAPVRIIAIPHTKENLPPNAFSYRYDFGEEVLFGGTVRGKYRADIFLPEYPGDILTVTAYTDRGDAVAQKSLIINPAEPELHFYEENPLRGLSHTAIKDSIALIGDETTIYGEPYFMAGNLDSPKSTFTWYVGSLESVVSANKRFVTLRREGGTGESLVELKAVNDKERPQYLRDSFSITF